MSDPYEHKIPVDQQARLNEVAAVLELARRTYFAQGELFRWTAQEGSAGRNEYEAAGRGHRMAQVATHAPAVASVMARTAGELLAGLAAVYRSGEIFAAPEPLVRSALENSAYACWVLDPQATGEQRAARVIAAELTTLAHDRSATKELVGVDNERFRTLAQRFDQLVALANHLFNPFAVPQGDRPRFVVGTEQYPTFTGAVVAWADGPGRGHVSGRGLYGSLCGGTHPKGLATRLNWNAGVEPNMAEQEVTTTYLANLATAALSPFYAALACLAGYHGWLGNSALANLEVAYDAALPGALR